MRLADAEDLSNFVEELKSETDRGLPFVGAALIDDLLQETLCSFFCEGRTSGKLLDEGNSPLGTFSSRIQACSQSALLTTSNTRKSISFGRSETSSPIQSTDVIRERKDKGFMLRPMLGPA
jgi:hypothetical protein